MIEKAIHLARLVEPTEDNPHPSIDVGNTEIFRLRTPSYFALERAARSGVDMTDPLMAVPAYYSVIIAAMLTDSSGFDAAFRPIRAFSPQEVALRMLPERLDEYGDVIGALVEDLNAEIKTRKGDSPNAGAATSSTAGGGKRSGSPSTRKNGKA